jgi:hypothetical protein
MSMLTELAVSILNTFNNEMFIVDNFLKKGEVFRSVGGQHVMGAKFIFWCPGRFIYIDTTS